jgi:ribA/ribD-fused uncharacterized protein
MRLIICGGRDFDDAEYAIPRFHRLHMQTPITTVISGMAKGGDTLGHTWAKIMGIPVDEYWADWKLHGPAAGPIRNEEMLLRGKPDGVLGLPGGTGTAHMCRIAEAAGVPVIRYHRYLFSRARDPVWGWASNFYPATQTDGKGVRYKTNEHYYQIQKTLNEETREWIASAKDATEVKRRGNDKSVTLRPDWDTYKFTAMMDGLRMKFPAGSELAQKLLDTGDLYLVEFAPWGDSFWGVDKTHKGQNWLGRLLMRRRDELIA